MNKILFSLLICLFFSALFAQDDWLIRKIDVGHNHILSNSQIQKQLDLPQRTFLKKLSFWKKQRIVTEGEILNAIQRLKNFYQKDGFLFVEIDYKRKKINKYSDLQIFIEENNPVLVKEITFFYSSVPDIETILQESGLRDYIARDEIFKDEKVLRLKSLLVQLLLENGYPDPQINFNISKSDSPQKVNLAYTLDNLVKVSYGNIDIKGNDRSSDKIILKHSELLPGKSYRQSDLVSTQRRIQQLSLFQYVTIRADLNGIHNQTIPMEIIVKELPADFIKFGAGYGLEDRFRLSLTYTRRGFLRGARNLTFFAKHSYLEPYHFSITLNQKAFINPFSSFIINPYVKKENESSYKINRYGLNLTFQQNLGIYSDMFSNYKFEKNYIVLKMEDYEETDLDTEYYNRSSISLGASFDNSLPYSFPEKGFAISTIGTLSGLGFNSRYHYIQSIVEVKKFQSLWSGLVIGGRVKLGLMKPIWNDFYTPIEDRFYAGGSNSVRGWSRGELGPKSSEDLPVGGDGYFESSIEFRQHLWSIFYGVAFLDMGNVWTKYDEVSLNELEYAGGLGVRVRTPIGPIRLDAAQPINSNIKRIQVHLSIGQAF